MGVLQGSILGPLLFIIYVNDLEKVSNILDAIMFANNTKFYYSNNNIQDLSLTTNKKFKNIAKWFNAIKLSLNLGKQSTVFFKSHQKKTTYHCYRLPFLSIIETIIKRIKFLEVIIEEK